MKDPSTKFLIWFLKFKLKNRSDIFHQQLLLNLIS